METHDERRDYYRINDKVGLQVEHCDKADIPSHEEFAAEANDDFKLINHLSRMDLDNSALLHTIQDNSPDVARYLKLINSKIDALAKQIVSMGLTDEVEPTEVTLSAGGISYISNAPGPESGYAKLRMILYPSNAVITSYGRVVRTGPTDDGYEVAFEYQLINESDRDALVRHVLQLQSNSLRKRATE
jgi:hypothetical protein